MSSIQSATLLMTWQQVVDMCSKLGNQRVTVYYPQDRDRGIEHVEISVKRHQSQKDQQEDCLGELLVAQEDGPLESPDVSRYEHSDYGTKIVVFKKNAMFYEETSCLDGRKSVKIMYLESGITERLASVRYIRLKRSAVYQFKTHSGRLQYIHDTGYNTKFVFFP